MESKFHSADNVYLGNEMAYNRDSTSAPYLFGDETQYNPNNSIYFPDPIPSNLSSFTSAQYSMPAMPVGYMTREFSNDSAGSTTLYEIDQTSKYESMQPSSRMTQTSYTSRATPSTLGWASESNLLHAYRFVKSQGNEPYFELLHGHTSTSDFPENVFLDPPNNRREKEFPCQYLGCDKKVFRRKADLERHYINVHCGPDQKITFSCDYAPCKTNNRPTFTRKDHFRDHLRDYHKEDIGTSKLINKKIDKKSQEWLKLQEAWIADRKISSLWWTCPNCLHRVQIATSAYYCMSCKYPCDSERADRIERVRQNSAASYPSSTTEMEDGQHGTELIYPARDSFCRNTGWISNEFTRTSWDVCTESQPSMERYQYRVDDLYDDGGKDYASHSRY